MRNIKLTQADVVLQNNIIEQAAATRPDGSFKKEKYLGGIL